MRLVLAAGLLAGSALAVPTASASSLVCDRVWYKLTGQCSPCETAAAIHDRLLTDRWWHCPDQ